jgi:hypothetical protein
MTKTWSLKRTAQCSHCPWWVEVDPFDIPNGYDPEKHRALEKTIAHPGAIDFGCPAMACHETDSAHCVGWLVNQLGPGNNVGLRIWMMSCENASKIRLRGEQHECFEDTLPEGY